MNSLWPVYPSANETFDISSSRFLVQGNDLNMNCQELDESYGPGITEFYPKNDDDYAFVNAPPYIIPNHPLMIPTNFMIHETNTTAATSPSNKKNLLTSIHSPTPSLVTDDEQDPQQTPFMYHDFQVQIVDGSFNHQRQQPSPDFRDNHVKGSSATVDFHSKKLSPDLGDNFQTVPSQPPSPVSPDGNGLGIVQITPPPSHQTTPRQKKRRVSRKLSLNTTTIITENQLTQPSSAIFTTTNTGDPTDVHEYDFHGDGKNGYAFSSSASSSRRSSVSGGKRRSIDDSDETPEERRRKFLERNRIAASKCRQKKKAAMQELKERADTISTRNASLHAFVNDLREELLTLKNQLLAHRNCNCNILQEYIRKDAHANTTATVTQKN